ncbi:cationic amino acid transporter 5 isoform X1 [Iris pallida]|uniref:Cationic amino acid transporter 5 isoform X1 n=1 Tax=Iris pallida TaxID=29817 RepID=A0AAX6GNY4_IRIPA|nr:cationic amino acid transporter 5 isoform X1 [Iris pallida]
MLSTKKTSYFNWIASVVHSVVIVFVIVAGFMHADTKNLTPFLPYGAQGVFQAAAIVYFAYGGFDNIATMAEETRNPSEDIPLGLLGSMSIITVIYCLMALSLSMMQSYTDIDPNAAYSFAFKHVGMKWAQYLVALGALKGMTTVLLVGALGQARYTTHIARSHIIPPVFALVHPKTGTPIYATLLITICSSCIALFSSLDILASLLSISTLFIFMMLPTALRQEILRQRCVYAATPLEAGDIPTSNHCCFDGDFGLLGAEATWLDGVRDNCSYLAGRDVGNCVLVAPTEDSEGLGCASGAVAAVVVDRHQSFSWGLWVLIHS